METLVKLPKNSQELVAACGGETSETPQKNLTVRVILYAVPRYCAMADFYGVYLKAIKPYKALKNRSVGKSGEKDKHRQR